jgi:hypothetical protein
MIDRIYPDGVDCVWVASDRNDNLGAFVTGGVGPIPLQVLNRVFVSVEDIEVRLCELPKSSELRLLVSMKRPDDFICIAERGFFVHDWRDIHRTARESTHVYELIAVPLHPISVDALSEPLRTVAASVRFGSIAFVDGDALDVRALVECREGSS